MFMAHQPGIQKYSRGILALALILLLSLFQRVDALSPVTPWSPEAGFQDLVYGSTTASEVHRIMGAMPNEVIRNEQMYPVIENHYYYGDNASGATVFVFENGLLAGLLYKTVNNNFIDLTYVLQDKGDRRINMPIWGDYRSYAPFYPNMMW